MRTGSLDKFITNSVIFALRIGLAAALSWTTGVDFVAVVAIMALGHGVHDRASVQHLEGKIEELRESGQRDRSDPIVPWREQTNYAEPRGGVDGRRGSTLHH